MNADPEEELIRQIYAAAFDPTQWVAVMERLAMSVGGLRGCLTRIDVDTNAAVEAILLRSDPVWVDAYAQHFWSVNVLMDDKTNAKAEPEWQPSVMTEEHGLERDAYLSSEYYNDFMRPQDVDRALFIQLGRSGSVASNINIGRRTGEVFETSDLEFAARMQPHMVRAYEIGRRIAGPLGVIRNLAEAFQQSPHAVLLVEGDGVLVYANSVAERLLDRDSGLTVINGRVTPMNSEAARQFERVIGQAARRDGPRIGGTMSIPRNNARLPLAVRTAPLPFDYGAIHRMTAPVLVCITDLEAEVIAPSGELRDLFGLTSAEIRLAAAVFEGLSLPEAAEQFGISINTVRFQLARIFDKTGVSRQAALVKLMMRLAGGPAS